MDNSDEDKSYLCSSSEVFSDKEQFRGFKNSNMLLNLGSKSDSFQTDQTPTPYKILLEKGEEVGLFQDLQNMNPFEETFRKAKEGMLSGTSPLEMASLSVTNNADDSLHTPHVIFPLSNETVKRKAPISPLSIPSLQPDSDPLCLSLENDELERAVVQQEADTSDETQISDINVSGCEDESQTGTIQFLLRMPNGKMVQLSSLPVEQMDATPSGPKEKDIPIIKVDSSFLKSAGDGMHQSSGNTNTAPSYLPNKSVDFNTSNSGASALDGATTSIGRVTEAKGTVKSKTSIMRIQTDEDATGEQLLNKMSLAKQKLKQVLMKNSSPASHSSSMGVTSSGSTSPTVSKPSSSGYQAIESRRHSSLSDESTKITDEGHDSSSVEEKRRRNRAAAMRCREKRKTWVKELERRANDMLRTNAQLQHEVSMLRDEVAQLKTLLLAHRDCPVTQAIVQGKGALPTGFTVATPAMDSSSQSAKRSSNRDQKSTPSTIVFQTSSNVNPVKPLILLNDPPVKRKRLNSSNTISSAAVSVVTSPPSSSTVHTLVLPSNNPPVLNTSFVNVIPSVLVANPTTSTSSPVGSTTQVIYSHILPHLPTLSTKTGVNVMNPKQAFILPKSKTTPIISEKYTSIRQAKSEFRQRTPQLLSTNVIKVNPNVIERDMNDSDIEILDEK